jgi:hypothetical protein
MMLATQDDQIFVGDMLHAVARAIKQEMFFMEHRGGLIVIRDAINEMIKEEENGE